MPDRNPLSPEQADLAARFLPLARKVARPYKVRYPRLSAEFESAACWALCLAAADYDPARGVKFVTFVAIRVIGALRDTLRAARPMGYRRGMVDLPGRCGLWREVEEHGRVLCCGACPQPERTIDEVDALEHRLLGLPGPHATACRLHYLGGEDGAGIARALGCSVKWAWVLHGQALAMLAGRRPMRQGRRPKYGGTAA